ncbi:hypothetical protein V6N13_025419 [Hibiscus sabdariffa]
MEGEGFGKLLDCDYRSEKVREETEKGIAMVMVMVMGVDAVRSCAWIYRPEGQASPIAIGCLSFFTATVQMERITEACRGIPEVCWEFRRMCTNPINTNILPEFFDMPS